MQAFNMNYKAYELICKEADESSDLYFIQSGKVLICTTSGTQVKVIARIGAGEFIGELSFFDGNPRASHIVTLENSVLIRIPKQELINDLPFWFTEVGKNLTKKIRLLDNVIQESNIRRVSTEHQRPLSIDEQRKIFSLITHQHA